MPRLDFVKILKGKRWRRKRERQTGDREVVVNGRELSPHSLSSRVSAAAQGVLNYRSNGKNGRLR